VVILRFSHYISSFLLRNSSLYFLKLIISIIL
jgi:hypothetical protein